MKIIKDQSGFTIIELITSFSLTMVVLVFLFNIVVTMKETYVTNSAKSDLIVTQSLLSTALNEDLYNNLTAFRISGASGAGTPNAAIAQYRVSFNGTNTYLKIDATNDIITYKGVKCLYTHDKLL